jgi:hypothetical protein
MKMADWPLLQKINLSSDPIIEAIIRLEIWDASI